MCKNLKILWNNLSVRGKIETVRCKAAKISVISQGKEEDCSFEVSGNNSGIIVWLDEISGGIGANEATVTVRSVSNPFTFKINDVNSLYPIFIAEYNVIVTTEDDKRAYSEIAKSITDKKMLSAIQKIDNSPEENYTNAFKGTLDASCPTWLGISRDIRIFEVGFVGMPSPGPVLVESGDYIKPRLGSSLLRRYKDLPSDFRYRYMVGRGISCENKKERSLEEGYMPILNTKFEDGGINYSTQMFATLEKSALIKENVRGIHYLVSETHFGGFVQTPEQEKQRELIREKEMDFSEEVVLYLKVTAQNNNDVPTYAFVTIPLPIGSIAIKYDNKTGFGTVEDDLVFVIASVNDKPFEQAETAILIPPREKMEYLFVVPHSPITIERAKIIMSNDYDLRFNECKAFWQEKSSKTMQISLPEKRIENMMKAGFYHLDLICTGKELNEPLAPNIGNYNPIGTESSPIIQYFDSIGRTDLAERALEYFFVKQHDDGFIQNFEGYMAETGAVLWTTYLHTLYTNNTDWIKGIEDKIVKACDYIIKWADKNKKEEFKGRGYGMLAGKCADPEDPYHSYMLNAYTYAGLIGAAKMLHKINSTHYLRINTTAEELKKNILIALDKSIADSPVIPLGNGLWCPSVSPWPEYRGPLCLSTDGGNFCTHCSVTCRDSLTGAIYLVYLNVIDKNSRYSDFIINSFSELLYQRNTAFSQPFCSQHSFVNLKRGEKKAFIKEFYNSMASLADNETYTFFEHFHLLTIHNTDAESWFLMRCRNMLYTEEMSDDGINTLIIMPGVPSAWFLSGEDISIIGANTYFGELSYNLKHIEPCKRIGIDVKLNLRSEKYPKIKISIPLPDNMFIAFVNAGYVTEGTNDIMLNDFKGNTKLEIVIKTN